MGQVQSTPSYVTPFIMSTAATYFAIHLLGDFSKNSRWTTDCRELLSLLDSTCIVICGIDHQLPYPISEIQYKPLNFHHMNINSRKSFTGVELHGKTLGVVGCGRIGQVTTQAFLQTQLSLHCILRIQLHLEIRSAQHQHQHSTASYTSLLLSCL